MGEADSPIDISILVSPATPPWPGDTPFSCMWTWDMSHGDSVNVSAVTSSPHVGTHADSPLHVSIGAPASESLSLDHFNGVAVVIDVSSMTGTVGCDEVMAAVSRFGRVERLLVRTGQTIADGEFPAAWPSLDPDCVSRLAHDGLLLLGVDAPSVDDRDSKKLDVHHVLLDRGLAVLENLDLRGVSAGEYRLNALPVKVAGLDAAAVRAVLYPRA